MAHAQFDGITEFILAAQLQSFTAAALRLGVTSSAVGKGLSRLEKRLGVKLLHRTTRRLTLTSEGEGYLATCLHVTAELANTEGCIGTGVPEPRGRLRIDLPAAFGRRYIAPMLYALVRKHPQLDVTLTLGERTVDLIADGIDLVVRIGALKDDGELVARRIGEQHLVICASPDYLQRRGPVPTPAALLEHDCVIPWRKGLRAHWLLKGADGTIGQQEINVRHEFGDGETTLQGVLAGCGLAQFPTWLVHEHLRSGALTTVLDEYAGASMPIHVIWPRTRYIQPKVRVAIDALLALAEDRPEIFRCGEHRQPA